MRALARNISLKVLAMLLLAGWIIPSGCGPKKASKCRDYSNSPRVKYNRDGTVKSKHRRNRTIHKSL
ncbi:MAG: hypothetical protein EXR21_06840 [Flavobacteriaceae bacterium]|nr:hypothetical protein [Flavobacteriaceae bacterium]